MAAPLNGRWLCRVIVVTCWSFCRLFPFRSLGQRSHHGAIPNTGKPEGKGCRLGSREKVPLQSLG